MRNALIVGIDYYKHTLLHTCAKNASIVNHALINNSNLNFINSRLVTAVSVPLKKSELTRQIATLFANSNEVAFFYFSGHGYMDSNNNGYLITSDCKSITDGLSIPELLKLTYNSKAKYKIIVLDFYHYDGLNEAWNDQFIILIDDVIIVNIAATSQLITMTKSLHHILTPPLATIIMHTVNCLKLTP